MPGDDVLRLNNPQPEALNRELEADESSVLPNVPHDQQQGEKASRELEYATNWAGNVVYQSEDPHFVQSIEDLHKVVMEHDTIKVVGSRHSFNRIADSESAHVVLRDMNRILHIDQGRMTVTVEGGILYGELGEPLFRAGYAIGNLASLPHISIVGACSTATHGSGDLNGSLATAVSAVEIMLPDGELVTYQRGIHEEFYGVVVGLGATGIVTKLSLDIEPAFYVRQDVYEFLPLEDLYQHFDAITGSAYSVSLFSNWQDDSINQVWLKRKTPPDSRHEAPLEFFGSRRATENLHPIKGDAIDKCTPQMGAPGPWHQRLSHFLFEKIPSNGCELQSEYILPRENAIEAIQRIQALRGDLKEVLQISEIRTIAADDFWMSPAYKQASVGIHFTWHNDWEGVQKVLPLVEGALMELGARPHWGKVFRDDPAALMAICKSYPRFNDFKALTERIDKNGKFLNSFLKNLLHRSHGE